MVARYLAVAAGLNAVVSLREQVNNVCVVSYHKFSVTKHGFCIN